MAIQVMPGVVRFIRMSTGRPDISGQSALLWLLATATEKDLPLPPALDAMAGDARAPWSYKLADLAALLRRGVTLPEALQSIPDILPPDALLAVQVGAATDTLAECLRDAAERLSEQSATNEPVSLGGVVLYLSGLLWVIVLVSAFLLIWIVPKYKKIFDDFSVELPDVTVSFIAVADLIASGSAGIILLPFLIGSLALPLFMFLWASGRTLYRLSPRRWWARLDVGPVLRLMGVVIGEGRPLIDALYVVSTQHPNQITWKKLSRVYEAVKAGESCWPMWQHERLLRDRERKLLEAAERVGNLPWTLGCLGSEIERRQDQQIRIVLQLVRPLGILCLGLGAGFVCVALFVPLVKLISEF